MITNYTHLLFHLFLCKNMRVTFRISFRIRWKSRRGGGMFTPFPLLSKLFLYLTYSVILLLSHFLHSSHLFSKSQLTGLHEMQIECESRDRAPIRFLHLGQFLMLEPASCWLELPAAMFEEVVCEVVESSLSMIKYRSKSY